MWRFWNFWQYMDMVSMCFHMWMAPPHFFLAIDWGYTHDAKLLLGGGVHLAKVK